MDESTRESLKRITVNPGDAAADIELLRAAQQELAVDSDRYYEDRRWFELARDSVIAGTSVDGLLKL